jgi:DNA-binding transcriptional regulator YhcF (GntR family)
MAQEKPTVAAAPPEPPRLKSLVAKMKIYNTTDEALREAIRAASDAGVNPVHHRAFIDYLRKSGQQDTADFVEGIGENDYRAILAHYGVIKEQVPKDPMAAPMTPPTGEEIFGAMLDAFEQDVNVCDKKKLVKWMRDNQKEAVAAWMEPLDRADFYKALSSFFGNLGRVREKIPEAMTSAMEEQAPVTKVLPAERPPDSPPDDEPQEEPPEEAPPRPEDVDTLLMDAYLEGVDITRRSQLVNELDKAGHEDAAEFIDALSLSAFYRLLAEFFERLSKALGEAKEAGGMRRLSEQVDPRREWLWMRPAERAEAMIAGDLPPDEADIYKDYEWHELPDYVQRAFQSGFLMISERRRRAEIELPFRRKKMRKVFTQIEAPEELFPDEVEEAVAIADVLREEFGIEEAAKRAAQRMGKKKGMPEGLVANLEKFLGKVMKEEFDQKIAPSPLAPKAPEKEVKPPEEKEPEKPKEEISPEARDFISKEISKMTRDPAYAHLSHDQIIRIAHDRAREAGYKVPEPRKESVKEQKLTPAAQEFISKKISDLVRKGYPQDQAIAIAHEMARRAGYDVPPPPSESSAEANKKKESHEVEDPKRDPVDEPSKVDSDEIPDMGDLLKLALSPSKFMGEAKRIPPPKGILIEATSSGGAGSTASPSGVVGAPGVGLLDVFSYGGYLEKTLPYLVAHTVSRMNEDDRAKFVNAFRKFVETNDIVQLTRLAGNLADIVEWGDATQEGAELVKTFRFLSDFLNMMRASVDYTKKAIQTSAV